MARRSIGSRDWGTKALGWMMKNNSREQTGRMMGALMRMSKLDVGAPEAAYPGRGAVG
jgi:hypothetical protein